MIYLSYEKVFLVRETRTQHYEKMEVLEIKKIAHTERRKKLSMMVSSKQKPSTHI